MSLARIVPPGTPLDRLELVRAAIAEVGATVIVTLVPEGVRTSSLTARDRAFALRAVWLSSMSLYGPDWLVRCPNCSTAALAKPLCITVRDALRGMTCGDT